jgi:hypothetical protein
VRTKDGFTGFIYGVEGDRYKIAICEHDEERSCKPSKLEPWVPRISERVVEADNEDSPIGIVVDAAGEEFSLVVWPPLRRQAK